VPRPARFRHVTWTLHAPDCRGCLSARAADGLLLCTHHTRLIPQLALNMAKLYPLLGYRLLGGASRGTHVGQQEGRPDTG
jgi:hypothetical protein